jgi:CheY-like chemotaxis protein
MDSLLVIEHDPPRLVMLAMILRALGYSVLEAGGQDDAVRESESHTGPIALALCDAQALAAGNITFTDHFNSLHPETRFVVLCDSRVTPITAEVVATRMTEPVNVGVLAISLRELLETARPPEKKQTRHLYRPNPNHLPDVVGNHRN